MTSHGGCKLARSLCLVCEPEKKTKEKVSDEGSKVFAALTFEMPGAISVKARLNPMGTIFFVFVVVVVVVVRITELVFSRRNIFNHPHWLQLILFRCLMNGRLRRLVKMMVKFMEYLPIGFQWAVIMLHQSGIETQTGDVGEQESHEHRHFANSDRPQLGAFFENR